MALRARKLSGAFEKRAPGLYSKTVMVGNGGGLRVTFKDVIADLLR